MATILEEVPITVMEGDDATVRIHIDDIVDNVKTAHSFVGVDDVAFLIKENTGVADDDLGVVVYRVTAGQIIITSAVGGNATVLLTKDALTIPDRRVAASLRYKVIETRNNRDQTLMAGPLLIENT